MEAKAGESNRWSAFEPNRVACGSLRAQGCVWGARATRRSLNTGLMLPILSGPLYSPVDDVPDHIVPEVDAHGGEETRLTEIVGG